MSTLEERPSERVADALLDTHKLAICRLDWRAKFLIREARERRYSGFSRNLFILAVGAVANSPYFDYPTPPYQHAAWTVLDKFHALELIEAEDAEMAHWRPKEWEATVQRISGDVRFKTTADNRYSDPKNAAYLLQQIDALELRQAYFETLD